MCTNLKDLRSGGEGRFYGCVSENGFLQLSAVFEHEDVFFQDGGDVHVVSEPGGVCCNMYVCMYVWVVSGQIAERRFTECHFAECISPNVILPMCFLPTCQKVEMLKVEMPFADMPFCRNANLPKCLQVEM